MAKSHYHNENFLSRDLVESAGAILFDFRHTGISLQQLKDWNHLNGDDKAKLRLKQEPAVALVHSNHRRETLLPKGRRNINEPRDEAAVRETYEETGLRCQLLPITLRSRATSVDPSQDRTNPEGYTLNEVRQFHGTTDPFWMTLRRHKDRQGDEQTKMIWWYIAVVDEEQDSKPIELDPGCELKLVPVCDAETSLKFEVDRAVVKEAIRIVRETLGSAGDF